MINSKLRPFLQLMKHTSKIQEKLIDLVTTLDKEDGQKVAWKRIWSLLIQTSPVFLGPGLWLVYRRSYFRSRLYGTGLTVCASATKICQIEEKSES